MPFRRTDKKDSRQFTIAGTEFTITDNKDGIIELQSSSDRQRHAARWLLGEVLRRDGAQFRMSQSNTRFYYGDEKVGEIADGKHQLTAEELFAKAQELSERIPTLNELDGFLIEEQVTLPNPVPKQTHYIPRSPEPPVTPPVVQRIIQAKTSPDTDMASAREATRAVYDAATTYLQANHVVLNPNLREGLHNAMATAHLNRTRGR